MKTKYVDHSILSPSYVLKEKVVDSESLKIGPDGRSYRQLCIAEKNYKGQIRKRLWLGIAALFRILIKFGTFSSISEKIKDDLRAAWSGKRLVIIYQFVPNPFLELPIEILHHIFSFFFLCEIMPLREACKSTRNLIDQYHQKPDVQFKLLNDLKSAYCKSKKIKVKNEYQTRFRSILNAILNWDLLEKYLENHNSHKQELLTHLNVHTLPRIDWIREDPNILKITLHLFFTYATNDQLAIFIKTKACAVQFFTESELRYPEFAKLFFATLTEDRRNRLMALSNTDLLKVIALGENQEIELLSLLYENKPNSTTWNEILYNPENSSILKKLFPAVLFLNTIKLFKQASSVHSVLSELNDLFYKSNFHSDNKFALYPFTRYLLHSKESLNKEQIKVLLQAIEKLGFSFGLILEVLESHSSQADMIFREFICLHAVPKNKKYFDVLVGHLTTKKRIKTYIEALNSCPEPWRTLHLRLLNNESLICKTLIDSAKKVFSDLHLNYKDYPSIEISHHNVLCNKKYIEKLLRINSEENLIEFLNSIEFLKGLTKFYAIQLRSIVGGVIIAKHYTLKPCLNEITIENQLKKRDLQFNRYTKPLTIEEFLKED